MMCAEVRERIAPWLSGEIDQDDRRLFEEHLGACAACASDAERARRALDLLATDDVPDPGPVYWSSFGGRLRERIAAARRRRRWLGLTAAIAAATIVVAGLALLQTRRGPAPGRAAGGGADGAATTPSVRALTVEQAEAHLREALQRGVAEGQDPREIDTILDDIAPADALEGTGRFGDLSPEEDRRLSDGLLDPRS